MAEMLIDGSKLDACNTAEANAIRAKTGGTDPIPYDYANNKGFADAIAEIETSGESYFDVSPTENVGGSNPLIAFLNIVNAVKAVKGDIPFYAWSNDFRSYKPMGIYYLPASITSDVTEGIGWYGYIQRPENNNAAHVFATIFGGFDPENHGSYNAFVTSARTISLMTTDVYRVTDLTGLFES